MIKQVSKLLSLFLCLNIAVFMSSCNEEEDNQLDDLQSSIDELSYTQTGNVVTDNPQETMSFVEVAQTFVKGDELKLRINRSNDVVEEYTVYFESAYNGLIYCTTDRELPVGSGDSGSPLLTTDGKVIGGLGYGYYGSNNLFIATSIDLMLALSTQETEATAKSLDGQMGTLGASMFIEGVDFNIFEEYQEEGANLRVANENTPNIYFVNDNVALSRSNNETTSAIPGNSIAINLVTGDFLRFGSIGTLTYDDGETMYAFAHGYSNYSPKATPVYLANMITLVERPAQMSFKRAYPTQTQIGTFVKNGSDGIVLSKDLSYQTITNTTNITYNDNISTYTHEIAQDNQPYKEMYLNKLVSALSVRKSLSHYVNYYDSYFRLRPSFELELTFEDDTKLIADTTFSSTSTYSYYNRAYGVDNFVYFALSRMTHDIDKNIKDMTINVVLEDIDENGNVVEDDSDDE